MVRKIDCRRVLSAKVFFFKFLQNPELDLPKDVVRISPPLQKSFRNPGGYLLLTPLLAGSVQGGRHLPRRLGQKDNHSGWEGDAWTHVSHPHSHSDLILIKPDLYVISTDLIFISPHLYLISPDLTLFIYHTMIRDHTQSHSIHDWPRVI